MHQARRHGVDDLAEGAAADVSIDGAGAEELGVIEDVEDLEAELQRLAGMQRNLFLQRHVEVLQAGAGEETARDIVRGTRRGNAEQRAVLKAAMLLRGLWLSCSLPGVKYGVSTPLLLMPLGLVPSSELSVLLSRVTGRPVEKCVMPEISQPFVQRLEARKRLSNGMR